MPKNILISVCGLTPQVITETLYALSVQQKNKIKIDEIYIVTTVEGREAIKGKHPLGPKVSLKSQLKVMCAFYKIPLPAFEETNKYIKIAKEESIELPDVRTNKDNQLFPNFVSAFIKEMTAHKDNTLYCSLAGGRKTMSTYMGFAMSLFGRENDKLLHVLASAEFEKTREFFPKNKKDKNAIVLSEVPFVKLRKIISDEFDFENVTYNELIETTQKQVKSLSAGTLIINVKRRTFRYGEKETGTIEPLPFSVYTYLAKCKIEDKEDTNISHITGKEAAKEIFNIFCKSKQSNREDYIKDFKVNLSPGERNKKRWWDSGIEAGRYRTEKSNIENIIKGLIGDEEFSYQFIIATEKIYGNSRYYIPANKKRLQIIE